MLAELQPTSRLQVPAIEADDAIRARNIQACDELLALLVKHHPEHNPKKPEVAVAAEPEPEPEPEPTPVACEPEEAPPPAVPKVRDIQRTVCWYFDVPLLDMLSHRRTMRINYPRQVAMWLTKSLTMKTLPEIGRLFDDRDHTTILHAVRKIEKLRETDEPTRLLLAHLIGVIKPA